MEQHQRKPKYLTSLVNLGNKELHNRHKVMVEPGNVPRSRVMDQHVIDKYLMHGLLTLAQHRAGEHLLQQAARAGIWPTGINWAGSGGGTGVRNFVPFGAFPFGTTLALIKDRYGDYHAFVTKRVVCFDWDVAENEQRMKCLRESLDLISHVRPSKRNALERLRAVAEKGKSL
jgi:hypothetical protein